MPKELKNVRSGNRMTFEEGNLSVVHVLSLVHLTAL